MARHIVLLLSVAALVSCSTLQEALDRPEDRVLAFGFLRVDTLLEDREIQSIHVVQTAPPGSDARMNLSARGGTFFTEPLPVGTRWRVVSVSLAEEDLAVSLDFAADRAGLLFLGSLEIGANASGSSELRRRSTPSERQLLQDLLDAWRGTAWEAVIRARMAEM